MGFYTAKGLAGKKAHEVFNTYNTNEIFYGKKTTMVFYKQKANEVFYGNCRSTRNFFWIDYTEVI